VSSIWYTRWRVTPKSLPISIQLIPFSRKARTASCRVVFIVPILSVYIVGVKRYTVGMNPYHEAPESKIVSAQDLFGIERFIKKNGNPMNERACLIKYFYDNAKKNWVGKYELEPCHIGLRLAHLSLQDLYAFKSMCEDRQKTQPGFVWSKFFWGCLKVRE